MVSTWRKETRGSVGNEFPAFSCHIEGSNVEALFCIKPIWGTDPVPSSRKKKSSCSASRGEVRWDLLEGHLLIRRNHQPVHDTYVYIYIHVLYI